MGEDNNPQPRGKRNVVGWCLLSAAIAGFVGTAAGYFVPEYNRQQDQLREVVQKYEFSQRWENRDIYLLPSKGSADRIQYRASSRFEDFVETTTLEYKEFLTDNNKKYVRLEISGETQLLKMNHPTLIDVIEGKGVTITPVEILTADEGAYNSLHIRVFAPFTDYVIPSGLGH